MVSKSVVSIIFICFSVDRVLTQKPPKVPQLFLPEPASSATPADVPLALQALQTAMPNSKGNSCYETLTKILQILANREQTKKSEVQTLLPVVEKLQEIKNYAEEDDIKKAVDVTSDALKDILEKNYQYQSIGTNMYKVGSLRKSAAPAKALANPVRIVTLPDNVRLSAAPNAYRPQNVCPIASYVGRNLANQNAILNPQRQTLDRNVWPVVPVTKINGCLNDNDAVVVVYKPKVLSVSNNYGNIVKASKMLVPSYVSKLQ